MIRVLQIYDSITINSGISSVIMSWIRNADRNKIAIDVLACWRREPDYTDEIKREGGKVFFIEEKDSISNYIGFIRKVYNFFSKNASNYDIVHLHSSIFSYPILFAARKYGVKKCIVHVHSKALGNSKLSAYRNLATLIPMKISKSNYWACSEEAAKVWFEKIGILQYTVVHNGIESEIFVKNKLIRNEYRKKWKIDDSEYLIGHVSNMSAVKNVPFIIEVLYCLINRGYKVKLVLIGKKELPNDTMKSIHGYNLENCIINAGVRDDVEKCVQAFDVCFMPSLSEGYGLVPIETEVAKVPVILSSGFPAVIKHLPLSFPVELITDEWVDKCEWIFKNKGEIDNLYDFGTYKKFDIKLISTEVFERYRRILGETTNEENDLY